MKNDERRREKEMRKKKEKIRKNERKKRKRGKEKKPIYISKAQKPPMETIAKRSHAAKKEPGEIINMGERK